VSRTIGDIEAKDVRYGGNPNVVIATPDIHSFVLNDNYDYIIMGCDGIFEKLSSKEVIHCANQTASNNEFHERSGQMIDNLLNSCIERKTLDNVTAVLIGFQSLESLA
jgi:protein phosphatase 2C family protein 2/3